MITLLKVSLFVAILSAPGISDHIAGSIILIIFSIPMNIINTIMDMKPILENNIPILSLSFR